MTTTHPMSKQKKVPDVVIKSHWGEKIWVRSGLTPLRKTFSEIFDFEKVYCLCKQDSVCTTKLNHPTA